MTDTLRILHLEDNPDDSELVKMILTREGIRCEIFRVETRMDFVRELENGSYHMVLADYSLPSFDGMRALALTREIKPTIPFILISGTVGEEIAVEALKAGGTDYILKERISRLPFALRRALTEASSEEALVASERRYRLIFEQNPLPMWVYDIETLSFLDVNVAAVRQYGFTKEEFLSMTIKEIRPPEDLPALVQNLESSNDQMEESGPWRHRTKDGKIIFVEISSHMLDFEGKKARIVLSHDITDRRKAEQELLEAENRYRGIFENAIEGIFQSTPEGKLITVNPAVARIFGYDSTEEFVASVNDVGREVFVNPKQREEFQKLLKDRRFVEGFEFEAFKKDGTKIWVSENVRLVQDQRENRSYYEGFTRDITERKEAQRAIRTGPFMIIAVLASLFFMFASGLLETITLPFVGPFLSRRMDVFFSTVVMALAVFIALRKQQKLYRQKLEEISERRRTAEALRQSEERFSQIAEAISEVFWMSDPKMTRIFYISPAYETIMQRSSRKLYEEPKSFFDNIHSEDREKVREEIRNLRDSGASDFEYRIVRPDGSIRWIWDRRFPISNSEGDIIRIAGIAQDVTERKFAEEQTRELQKQLLQVKKIEAIGQLAGGVAHDFNNILMAVEGYSELLLLKSTDDSQRAEIMEIRNAAQRGANLTRQLLAFSRRQILSPKVLDLEALIRNMENMVQRLIGENIELTTTFAENLRKIEADPGQIEQVVMNLAVNARDAMPHGGRLIIEANNIDLDEQFGVKHLEAKPGRYVLLSVKDAGYGMDEATISRIFEPFFTTKQEGKGTGLGLATVYGIVKQSGGHISVDSQPAKGTTFNIYFPATDRIEEVEGAQTTTTEIRADQITGRTILLTDDNQGVRSAISNYLEMKGFRVLQAERGSQAIEIARKNETSIELLISDIVMPEMSGSELATELKKILPDLKILLMSGYTDEAFNQQEEGTVFLSKPVKMEVLVQRISDLLQS